MINNTHTFNSLNNQKQHLYLDITDFLQPLEEHNQQSDCTSVSKYPQAEILFDTKDVKVSNNGCQNQKKSIKKRSNNNYSFDDWIENTNNKI